MQNMRKGTGEQEAAEQKNSQPVFILKASDITADLVVDFWIVLNGKVRELVKGGMSPAAAVQYLRGVHHLPPILCGLLPAEKLQGACKIAESMREFPHRKVAD